jgi:hypothetical protein
MSGWPQGRTAATGRLATIASERPDAQRSCRMRERIHARASARPGVARGTVGGRIVERSKKEPPAHVVAGGARPNHRPRYPAGCGFSTATETEGSRPCGFGPCSETFSASRVSFRRLAQHRQRGNQTARGRAAPPGRVMSCRSPRFGVASNRCRSVAQGRACCIRCLANCVRKASAICCEISGKST